jgi:hypothetical protein
MSEILPEEAIVHAREALGLPASVSGRALRVERLGPPESAYYLVALASSDRERYVAAIDARTAAVDQHAKLVGAADYLTVDMEQALAAAGLGAHASARLVWRPCRASYSPLYPIWEISSAGERRYVDQQAQVWSALTPSGRGGGADPIPYKATPS